MNSLRDKQRGRYGAEVMDATSFAESIEQLAEIEGKMSPNMLAWAIRLRPGAKGREELRNPEWLQFIVENEDSLRAEMPWLFDRNYIIDALKQHRGEQ